MNKDWFPFFSMLFWFCTKVTGLWMVVTWLWGLVAMFGGGLSLGALVGMAVLPAALGSFLLMSDMVFDIATAEQRRRRPKEK
jgi:hypothetical protein